VNTSGTGGAVTIKGGNGAATNASGGNVVIQGGTANGTGTIGSVIVKANGSDSTTAFQVQKSDATALLTADTTNMVVKIGTTGSPTFGTTTRLFVTIAEVSTTLRIGDGTNGVNYNDNTSGKLRYIGTARNVRTVNLVPEYAGATITGDGTNNVGTMTSDFCSGTSHLSIPSTSNPCAATEEHNYYSWTAQATNDYDIYVRYQMPDDFSAFSTSGGTVADASNRSIKMYGWRTASTESVQLSVYNSSATLCGTGSTNVSTGTATWTQTNYASGADNENSCSITAGSIITFRIRMTVGTNNDYARAGEITFNYLSSF
jgi:hypothetical protein